MPPALTAPHIATVLDVLCALIARHGHLRRLAGPLLVLIWQRVRTAGAQASAVLARMQAGTLRRYPHRRTPRPVAAFVEGDAPEPGFERPLRIIAVQVGQGGDEGVLHHVIGLVGVADVAAHEAIDPMFVASHQQGKGALFARSAAADEI